MLYFYVESEDVVKGTCVCGAIEVTAPNNHEAGVCHCTTCRRWGGGPFFGVHAEGEVSITGDTPSVYRSSAWAERGFCPTCGTHLFYRMRENQHYIFPAGLFQDQEFTLVGQVFVDQQPPYYELANETRKRTRADIFHEAKVRADIEALKDLPLRDDEASKRASIISSAAEALRRQHLKEKKKDEPRRPARPLHPIFEHISLPWDDEDAANLSEFLYDSSCHVEILTWIHENIDPPTALRFTWWGTEHLEDEEDEVPLSVVNQDLSEIIERSEEEKTRQAAFLQRLHEKFPDFENYLQLVFI